MLRREARSRSKAPDSFGEKIRLPWRRAESRKEARSFNVVRELGLSKSASSFWLRVMGYGSKDSGLGLKACGSVQTVTFTFCPELGLEVRECGDMR